MGLEKSANPRLQYVTKSSGDAQGNNLEFYFVAPHAANPSTPITVGTSSDSNLNYHDLPFSTPVGSGSALAQTLPGPSDASSAGTNVNTIETVPASQGNSASGLADLIAQSKHVLPYASEPFGVYQTLLGWRSNLTHERISEATAYRFAAATRLIGKSATMSVEAPIGTPETRLAIDRTGTQVGAQLAAHISSMGENNLSHEQLRTTLSNKHNSALSSMTAKVITALNLKNPMPQPAASKTRSLRKLAKAGRQEHRLELPMQFETESSTATLLSYLGKNNPAIVSTIFRSTLASWERVLGAASLFATNTPARDAFLSPIGILHLFREYFFELGTFLGPPVGHVWVSPGGTLEVIEVNTRRQLVEQTIEQSTETVQKTDLSETQQDELSDAVKTENANDTKLGVTATASGGLAPVFQASGSSSLNLDMSRKQAQEQTHKQMREQSTKLSSEVRQNYKTTFRTVTETTDTSSRRYVLQNTTSRLVSYELSRKMRKVAVQVQDLGRQLCWQAFVDNPGDTLGLGEFVNSAASSLDPGIKPPRLSTSS